MNDTPTMRLPAAEIAPGQPQRLGQPIHDDRLELRDGGAADPVEVGAVEGVRVHLGEGGRVAAGAGEKRHEARAGPVGDAREDLGLDVGVDGGPWLRVEGRVGGEEGTEVAWFDGGDDAAVGDGVVVFGDWEVVGQYGSVLMRAKSGDGGSWWWFGGECGGGATWQGSMENLVTHTLVNCSYSRLAKLV